jgi:hypothetical protein
MSPRYRYRSISTGNETGPGECCGNKDNPPSGATELPFRTKGLNDVVLGAGCDISWNDPLYEEDSDVIAVFDIDYKQIDRDQLTFSRIFSFYLLLAIYLLVVGKLNSLGIFVCFMVGPWVACAVTQESFRQKRVHVAVTHRGIFLDEVAHSENLAIQRRQVVAYGNIERCYMQEVVGFFFQVRYDVALVLKTRLPNTTTTNAAAEQLITIHGLLKIQSFVDLIQAMMARSCEVVPDAFDAGEVEMTEASVDNI